MKTSLGALAAIISLAICALGPASNVQAQAPNKDKPLIEVHASVKSKTEGSLILEVIVKNLGAVPAYVITDPYRVDSSKGPYFDTDSTDPSTLVCSFQMYPPDPFHPFNDGRTVRLLKIKPGASHVEVVQLSWPMKTTEPPFGNAPGTRDVLAGSVKHIEVRIGLLPASAPLSDLVMRKRVPHDAFTGMERIETGSGLKSLYEIQEIVRSNAVDLDQP
jgi:hypothetical protein